MFKLILKFILLIPLNLIMLVLAFMLAPILPLFANENGWLPNYLNWFQTPDNSLDGDSGFEIVFPKTMNRYLRRVLWLLRNPLYGFDHDVLGIKLQKDDVIKLSGNEKTSNEPLNEGYVVRKLYRDDKVIAFQFYFVKAYNLFGLRCIRINLGWKLWGSSKEGSIKQYVLSFNPWMKI